MADAEAPASPTAKQAESTLTVLAPPPMQSALVQPVNQRGQNSTTVEMKTALVAQRPTPYQMPWQLDWNESIFMDVLKHNVG